MTARERLYGPRMKQLARDFGKHELLKCDEIDERRAMLRIGRPGCCNLLTDIAISLGHVVVWGDVDTCSFLGWDNGPWQGALRWLGARSDWHYLQSKASRGTGWDAVRGYDTDIAKADLLEARRERCINADAAREAMDVLTTDGSVERAIGVLYDSGHDAESCDIGEVVSSRVLMAVAAIRRAHELVNGKVAE